MPKRLFVLLLWILLVSPSVGQTLYQEGRGLFLDATALQAKVPGDMASSHATGNIAYRFTARVHGWVGLTSQRNRTAFNLGVGLLWRFGDTGWGVRSENALLFPGRDGLVATSLSLFRQLDLGSRLSCYPNLRLETSVTTDISETIRSTTVGYLALPVDVRIHDQVFIRVTPSYPFGIHPALAGARAMDLSLGAAVRF